MSSSLVSLHIRDFAIISALDIDFAPGFTVLSGETGAGKSILFDALGLVMGARADSGVVRQGALRSEVSAEFSLAKLAQVQKWLTEQGLLDDSAPEQLMLRRQIQASGQSRAFINGTPCNLGQLRQLSERLLDIHGQHAHQSLLKGGEQRRLLDAFGKVDKLLLQVGDIYQQLTQVERQIESLAHAGTDTTQRRELLKYQLQELDELAPSPEDYAQLDQDYRRLSEADNLLMHAASAANLLYSGEDSLYDLLQKPLQSLQQACAIDPRFESALQLCQQAQIGLKEAAQTSDDLAGDVDPDPATLQQLSQRLDTYQSLARKHRVTADELATHWADLRQELETLESAGLNREALVQQRDDLLKHYQTASDALFAQRCKAAEKLSSAITTTVRPLGLPHARCEVQVEHRTDQAPQRHGQDVVEFLVAMNPGQPAAPMAKVASGGELARTSLAIQVVCLNQSPVPVLLFDEVDVGIGGGVAEVVGRRLKELAANYQVFCVTHQPQVAALADTHFAVSKTVEKEQTFTRIESLNEVARVDELARMLGGVQITQQTRSHAQEMLDLAQA